MVAETYGHSMVEVKKLSAATLVVDSALLRESFERTASFGFCLRSRVKVLP
jgi:hypothetical protein